VSVGSEGSKVLFLRSAITLSTVFTGATARKSDDNPLPFARCDTALVKKHTIAIHVYHKRLFVRSQSTPVTQGTFILSFLPSSYTDSNMHSLTAERPRYLRRQWKQQKPVRGFPIQWRSVLTAILSVPPSLGLCTKPSIRRNGQKISSVHLLWLCTPNTITPHMCLVSTEAAGFVGGSRRVRSFQ